MWTLVGDSISMIYTGTASTLSSVCMKGYEDFSEKFGRYYHSTQRAYQNNFLDGFKQECVLILLGQHDSSKTESDKFADKLLTHTIHATNGQVKNPQF